MSAKGRLLILGVAVLLGGTYASSLRAQDIAEFPAAYGGTPWGIVVGPFDRLWYTDWIGGRVSWISQDGGSNGSFLLPGYGRNPAPQGIALGPDGNIWFTTRGSWTSWVGRLSPDGQVTEFSVPVQTGALGQICLGPDGNLWFPAEAKIWRLTPSGTLSSFPIPTPFISAYGIAAGPDGNVWFTEPQADKIGRITPQGQITEFTLTSGRWPREITSGPDGNLWFTEMDGLRIGRMTRYGELTEFPIPAGGNHWPHAIAAGPDGNIWFTESNAGVIGRITMAGVITEFAVSFTPSMWGIVAGPDGNIWFTDSNGRIGRVTTGPCDAPAATNSGPTCDGGSVSLSASSIPSAVYSWTGPGGFVSSEQNPVLSGLTPATSGPYRVTASVGACTSATSYTTVHVYPIPAAPIATNNGPACPGDTVQLSTPDVEGATYSWTGPAGFAAGSRMPSFTGATAANAGVYNVTITVAGCQSPPGSTTLVVKAQPPAPTVGSNGPICQGGTVLLSASTIAGASYFWTGPNGFSSTAQNPVIPGATPSISGTYSVTATVDGCSSTPAGTAVLVKPTPSTPTVGNNGPICAGSTLSLTAGSVAGATYAWIGPGGFTSTQQNPTIPNATELASGIYSVTVTVDGCSTVASTSAQVRMSPVAPLVSANSPVCAGQTLQLNAAAVSGATYSWTGPNGFTSNLRNPVIGPVASVNAGTYTVWMIVNGCPAPPATVVVAVAALPAAPMIAAPSSARQGTGGYQASVTAHSGSSYLWTIVGGTITAGQGTSQITFSADVVGTLVLGVTETNATSCVSPAAGANVTVVANTGLPFYALTPCRVLDTRSPAGPLGAPAIAPSGAPDRSFTVTNTCGIPADAKAISVNVTVTNVAAAGSLLLYRGDGAPTSASTISIQPSRTRANNAIVQLAGDGSGTINVHNISAGTTDLIVDVNGVFR